MNEIVEAVRERVRMADGWAKSTGYPPADYFDTMMDLRRLLGQIDESERCAKLAEKEAVLKLLEPLHTDSHGWSRRPCATCQKITDDLGVRFGCIRYAHEKAAPPAAGAEMNRPPRNP